MGRQNGLPDSLELFGNLPLLKVIVWASPILKDSGSTKAQLPSYLGSTWRGVIGQNLQKLVCPFVQRPRASECTIKDHCPYFQLFEQVSSVPGFSSAPRGYILFPDQTEEKKLRLEITLFGTASRFVSALARAILRAQKSGLGADRVQFNIIRWAEILPGGDINPLSFDLEYLNISGPFPLFKWIESMPIPKQREEIVFVTPMRLRQKGKYLFRMDWPFFFSTLVRRLEILNILFNRQERIGSDLWLQLNEAFSQAYVARDELYWKDLKRYSNRQCRKVPLGGLVGKVVVENISLWWWRWWQMAALVHVGKGTNMGLGKVAFSFHSPIVLPG